MTKRNKMAVAVTLALAASSAAHAQQAQQANKP